MFRILPLENSFCRVGAAYFSLQPALNLLPLLPVNCSSNLQIYFRLFLYTSTSIIAQDYRLGSKLHIKKYILVPYTIFWNDNRAALVQFRSNILNPLFDEVIYLGVCHIYTIKHEFWDYFIINFWYMFNAIRRVRISSDHFNVNVRNFNHFFSESDSLSGTMKWNRICTRKLCNLNTSK